MILMNSTRETPRVARDWVWEEQNRLIFSSFFFARDLPESYEVCPKKSQRQGEEARSGCNELSAFQAAFCPFD
jgi:hypothetical protein